MLDDSIAAPGLAHRAMAPELDLLADLMGGTSAMRRGGQRWLLLQIGLGGYVVGRSVEKISPQITAISHAAPPRRRHGPQVKPRPKSRPASGHAKSG